MHYFLGIGIPHSITGVDKAQFNRLKLFKKYNLSAKIITVQYHHLGHYYAMQHKVEKDVINMYDYFQKCLYTNATSSFDYVSYWRDEKNYDVEILSNSIDVKVKNHGKMIIYARFFDNDLKSPMFINYFNDINQFVKHEEYDIRGFLSSISHYAPGNATVYQEFLTPAGEKVLEKYYKHKEKDQTPTMIMLKNEYGQFEKFNHENDLITYFLDKIYNPNDYFIIDRPLEIVPPLLNMKNQPKSSVVIHMKHLGEINPEYIRLKWPYVQLFDNLNRFDALITSTSEQKNDILQFMKDKGGFHPIDIHHIPVGYVSTQAVPYNYEDKNKFKLISIARYVEGKQLEDQIKVVHRLHDIFPEITLDLYGFGSQQYNLQNLINEFNANEYIKLKGYESDLEKIYQTAAASLLTSNSEGFALAVLESLSYNTPVFAYDIKYGPKEMVVNDINGNLVEYNNMDALFETLKSFISNKETQEKYFTNCYSSIENYYDDNIIEKWKLLLKE